MDDIKNLLVAMGVGFLVGAMVTASNKKVQEINLALFWCG